MKVTAAITILAVAANTVMAVPVAPRAEAGIFDAFGNVIGAASDIVKTGIHAGTSIFGLAFDGATCGFTSFFGFRRPTCQGRAFLGNNGKITTTTTKGDTKGNTNSNTNVSHESNNDSFSFTYSTEEDGRLKVTITPDAKGKAQCITIVKKEGEIKEIITREANKCL
ncbi:hypothetical protein CDV36_006283 [Fusarium kuroshium]|uniref:Secreted protein n=3 Tax=Fusarium solani species complex TaxID=232080 RepID=A0A3M2S926_9HYPO|nr:hypothetical protein CDV36_006283 [Fusarium kuroshium]RSL74499.1 hypothetical protein CEP51_011549 [Fusarium floridanum]RSM11716.1 hypothetical protein CEP52_002847 [Fusarium oligoseptatum]